MRKTLKKYFLWAILLLFAAVIVCESCYIVVLRQQGKQRVAQQNELIRYYTTHRIDYKNTFTTSSIAHGSLLKGDLKNALAWSNFVIDTFKDDSYKEDIDGYKGDTSWPIYMHDIRGDVYYAIGDYAKAIDDYSIVINLNAKEIEYASLRFPELYRRPKYDVYIKRANAFRNFGDARSAIQDFCNGILLAKDAQDRTRDNAVPAVFPPLPDDLLDYLEKHRDMVEDNAKFEKCVQILRVRGCPGVPVQEFCVPPTTEKTD